MVSISQAVSQFPSNAMLYVFSVTEDSTVTSLAGI
jgi:hypothetical protein